MDEGTMEVSLHSWLQGFSLVAVIPAFKVEREIEGVLQSMPSYLRHIVVVDDASPDRTGDIVRRCASIDPRIILLQHSVNRGVGGAMVTGFQAALRLRAQVIVKIDGDGQMNMDDLPDLLLPLIRGEADYSKGNRFHDFNALRRMPALRRVGNLGLSFFTKAAVGYWNCFDPTNGFVAIRGSVLVQLPLERIHRSYFFETSMLGSLFLLGARVKDVPLPSRYGSEISSLSIGRTLLEFPWLLLACLCRRLVLKNLIYDFTMETIFLICGLPLLLGGVIFGGIKWIHYASIGISAPTGTVVISALMIILGFQILLSALGMDMQSTPIRPICGGPLRKRTSSEEGRENAVVIKSGKPYHSSVLPQL